MLPLSMICPLIVYCAAIIPLAIETYRPRDPECYSRPGHSYYRVAINVIFGIFGCQVALEIGTFFAALIGGSHVQEQHTYFFPASTLCHRPCCIVGGQPSRSAINHWFLFLFNLFLQIDLYSSFRERLWVYRNTLGDKEEMACRIPALWYLCEQHLPNRRHK